MCLCVCEVDVEIKRERESVLSFYIDKANSNRNTARRTEKYLMILFILHFVKLSAF